MANTIYKISETIKNSIQKKENIDTILELYEEFLSVFKETYVEETSYFDRSSAGGVLPYATLVITDAIKYNGEIHKFFQFNYNYYNDNVQDGDEITPYDLDQMMQDTEFVLLAFYDRHLVAYEKVEAVVKEVVATLPQF